MKLLRSMAEMVTLVTLVTLQVASGVYQSGRICWTSAFGDPDEARRLRSESLRG